MLLDLQNLVIKYNMNIKGVLHIGAHFGEENNVYNHLNIQNRTFFEPLSKNFETLKQNIGESFLLHQLALGNENKTVEMNVETANMGQSSSILKPILHLTQYPHIKFESTEKVQMRRLDDLDLEFEKYNFINIDVQGYELEVFKGAAKTLEKIDFIMSEINRDEVYENNAYIEDIDKFLSDLNFERVVVEWTGGTWGDALYIKNKGE